MKKTETESSVSMSLYQHPSISIIALDAPVLGLSEVSDERLNAVFDNNYEEEDASEAF